MDNNETLEQLDDELDKALLSAIKNGVDTIVGTGKNAHVECLPASAAILNVARQRLRDLNFSKIRTPGTAADELANEMGITNEDTLKMPSMKDYEAARDREAV